MIFLFRSGTVREKVGLILRATRTHAANLAKYATIYKATMLALKHMGSDPGKEGSLDTFIAGLLGGYLVFGRRSKRGNISSVSKQIVIFSKNPNLPRGIADVPSFCSSRARPSPTLHPAGGGYHQELGAQKKNLIRCVAGLRSPELGKRDVAFQMVSGHGPVWAEEQYGLYLRSERPVGWSEEFPDPQQVRV
jgi:hypothetical protein